MKAVRITKLAIGALGVAALLLVIAGQQLSPAGAVLGDTDGDGILDLGEVISGSDPDDPASTPEDRGADFLFPFGSCSDGIDNDGDGLTDAADDGCQDDDNDIVSNAMELLLGSDPNSSESFPEDARLDAVLVAVGFGFIGTCSDGVDNDRDGLTDGNDPNCEPVSNDGDDFDDVTEKRFGSDPNSAASVPEHDIPNPGSCSDGIDNDLDGLTDAADPGCRVPDNDHFADATAIGALPFTDTLKMTAATREPGEARSSCFFGDASTVWYSFTPAAETVVVADTAGSDFFAGLAVWTQTGSRLSEVACAAPFLSSVPARVAFRAEAGRTYFFQLSGFLSEELPGNLTFNAEAGTPPPNDQFAAAALIAGLPFNDTVDLSSATTQFGEPRPQCAYYDIASTVWYRLDSASEQLLVFETDEPDFFAAVGIWTESKFGLAPVTCGAAFFTQQTRLAAQLEAGRTYYIQLGAGRFGPPPGEVKLSIDVAVPPANDDFAGATTVGSLPFQASVDSLTATSQIGEPLSECLYEGLSVASVWYRYTPVADTILRPSVRGEFFGTSLAVYTGTSLEQLVEVGCAQPFYYPETTFGFEAQAGVTYYFQAGRIAYEGGLFFPGASSEGRAAGIVEEPPPPLPPGIIEFELEEIPVPDCDDPDFTVSDPTDDFIRRYDPPPGVPATAHDIVSVSGGRDGDSFCLTVGFAGTIAPPQDEEHPRALELIVDIDSDQDRNTGPVSIANFACGLNASIGVNQQLYVTGELGVLVPVENRFFGPPPIPIDGAPAPAGFFFTPAFAVAVFEERSVTLSIPLSAIGGDVDLDLAVVAEAERSGRSDCAPNGGFIRSPEPLLFGDANCDGAVNAIDTAVILQMVAGLVQDIPCRHLADINGSGIVGPLDAQLILQYDAGILPSLEAVAGRR